MGAGSGFGAPKYEQITMRTLLPSLDGIVDAGMDRGLWTGIQFHDLFKVVLYNFEPLEEVLVD